MVCRAMCKLLIVILSINSSNFIVPTLCNTLLEANKISIINDNKHIFCDNSGYNNVINALESVLTNSHEMPALGISLDRETKQEITNGLWLELSYDTVQYHNDLPFDRLLIQVEEDWCGLNIIRHYNDRYEGRCFYIDLQQPMKPLYDCLIDITKRASS